MKKAGKIIGLSVLGIVMILAGLFVWLGWSWSPKEIVSVADQFHPEAGWKLTSETITPPRNLCIDDTCPQVIRDWDIPKRLKDRKEFINIIERNNLHLDTDEECLNLEQILEKRENCIAKGYVSHYYVRVEYRGRDTSSRNPAVRLLVMEKKDAF